VGKTKECGERQGVERRVSKTRGTDDDFITINWGGKKNTAKESGRKKGLMRWPPEGKGNNSS